MGEAYIVDAVRTPVGRRRGISDGAAALLIASEQAVRTHGLTPAGPDRSRVGSRRRSWCRPG
jgi:acetyl-CoA acetyltransferase